MSGPTILHPTDLLPHSDGALAHALRIALAQKGLLEMVHVAGAPVEGERNRFPDIRSLLDGWGALSKRADTKEIEALDVEWTTVHLPPESPSEALVRDVSHHPVDLIVLRTEPLSGLSRFVGVSVGDALVARGGAPVLLLAQGVSGFVTASTGDVSLKHIIIGVENAYLADLAIDATVRLLHKVAPTGVEVTLVHVSDRDEFPAIDAPDIDGWSFTKRTLTGSVTKALLAAADGNGADLIVLATRGRDSLGDALFGTTLQQVLRDSRCAVMSIPGRS